MPLYINEIFSGLETDEKEGLLDVYAFLVGSSVYIEVLKVRLSLPVAKSKFISAMVERQMGDLPRELRKSPSRREVIRKKFAPRREFVEENGAWTVREMGGAIGACLYMVYDSSMSRMNLSPDSTPSLEIDENTGSGPMNTELLRMVTEWVSEYFGVPEEDLEFVAGPVPFTDYEIHTLSEYPIIYQMAADLKMNIKILDETNVLLIDYGTDSERGDIFTQIKEKVEGFGGEEVFLAENGSFVYEDGGRPVFAIESPFYVVNRAGQKPIGIANRLLRHIIHSRSGNSTPESRLRDGMRLAYYMGRDLGSISYAMISQGVAQGGMGAGRKDEILRALGVEETDQNRGPLGVLCFVDMLMGIYSSITSTGVGNPFDKRFYVSAQSDGIKNREMFDALFDIVDEKDGFYMLKSPFNLPPLVLSMFGFSSVADMYALDPASSTLTENISYRVDRARGGAGTAPGTTSGPLAQSMIVDAKNIAPDVEDRHRESLLIHGLSSIPACNVPAQNIFSRRDVEFQDIMIILIHDTQNSGQLGGYASPRNNSKPVSMFKNVRPFQPPFIMLNLAAPVMKTIEERIAIILHEVSHFVDDLLVMDGRADSSVMKVPPQPQTSDTSSKMQYWQQYLGKSPTEIDAHAEEAYYYLSMYSYDYACRNKAAIRRKIVAEILGPVSKREPQAITVERQRLYNEIFERAWKMYENDHLVELDEIPALEPGAQQDDVPKSPSSP